MAPIWIPIAADIGSVKKEGNNLVITLKAAKRAEEYRLDDNGVIELLNFAQNPSFSVDSVEKITLGGKSGDIKRIKENKGVTIMSKDSLGDLVKQVLMENSGKGYSQYPYGSSVRDEEEPKQDYLEEWKALGVELIKDESRNTAIEIAKLLVKDLELFEDVLDLAGQNQSVGQEILSKLKQAREDS
jgi:hypothetical protein